MVDLTLTEQQRAPRLGHSSVPDALAFLEALGEDACERWAQLGGDGPLELGREGDAFEVADMDIRPHGQAERVA